MTISERFREIGEFGAAGMYEEPERSLFYRKALGLRRYYENCMLAVYQGDPLYPSGVLPNQMNISPNNYFGMAISYPNVQKKDPTLADTFIRDFGRYFSSVPAEHTVAGNMSTHSMPHYERVLAEGFDSYIPRIEKIADTDLREGLLHLIEGIRCYRNRCVDYLKSVSADGRLIAALERVPFQPARDIYEAIEAWNFVLYLDGCDNLGCLAEGLTPYHRGEDVTDLLRNLYDNLDANNGYSMALGSRYSALTRQCLEASKGKRRPMIELFVDENTPDDIWNLAFESVRSGNGQPAFYNGSVLLPGLKAKFPVIRDDDLHRFCGGGCTESMLAGLSNVGSLDAGINLLLILERVIYEQLPACASFSDFCQVYLAAVREVVDRVCAEIGNSQLRRAEFNPLPMRTLLVDDCIDNGTDFNNGGARYKWSIINFAGLINVIDSLLVIRDYIYRDAVMSAGQMIACLRANDPEFLAKARKHPVCFGKDDPDANDLAGWLSGAIYSMLDGKKPPLGEGFIPASIQFNSQADAGKAVGATPDGREAGSPLCDSLGAIFGKDTEGPTALLKSVASLDLSHALGIPVLNFNIAPDFDPGLLKALILGYMELGGIQIQITCTSAERLREAYEHPDLHRDLVVRVGGYSEYFNRLSDELKRMVINRTIQKMK